MMISSKWCAKRKLQICLKIALLVVVIGLYFGILLRESIAAWELIKVKNSNQELLQLHNVHKYSHRKSMFKRNHIDERHSLNKSTTTTAPPPTTLNPIYEYSEEMNAAAEQEFNQRRNKLWEICRKINFIGKYPPNAWEFFLSPGHGIAWCNVFKAASSTMMYYFNILAGYNVRYLQRTKASPLELARKRFPRPSQSELSEALTNALSFLIVREPFERLLSAYRNKLEGFRNKYYKLLGEQIVKKYRKGNKPNRSGPTFKEFLTFLTENHKSNSHFDEHWAPIYMFCTPCSINYTLIAKVETFQRDSEYIIRQAGLETLLLNKLPDKKFKMITNQSSSQTNKLISKYFAQIDDQLLSELLDIYGPDFELFGYNSTKYYDLVQTRTTLATTTKSTTMHQ